MIEIWKPIKNYENYYSISNLGNVKNNKTGKILCGDINNAGYRRITLYNPVRKRYFIHRLVAYHFCDGYSSELVVNHVDGNKLNNYYKNLEWVTRSENDLHAYRLRLRIPYCGISGIVYYQSFDLSTGAVLKVFTNIKDVCNNFNLTYCSGVGNLTVRKSYTRGWIWVDWRNKKLGKVGFQRVILN